MDTLTFKDGTPITSAEVDRVLGISDSYLAEWADDNESHPDEYETSELAKRRAEWDALRPLLVAAPDAFAALKALVATAGQYLPDGCADWPEAVAARAILAKAGIK